jgi:phage-related protein
MADVTVVIGTDNKGAVTGIKQVGDAVEDVEKKSGKASSALGDVAKIAGGFVVAQGLMKLPGLIGGFIGGASDLNESLSKVQTVFGSSAGDIDAWSKTAATGMGMTRGAALEAAGTFGNFLQAMGATTPAAADMSKKMVQLATDLGSFNNADPTEVLLALRSGLSGESEPLRKFGVALSEAAVSAKAVQLGLSATGKELTEQQKIQARYAIIMDQTKTAQGDFARTSGGLANQTKILKAELGDAANQIGTAFLPGVVAVAGALISALPAIMQVGGAVGGALMNGIRDLAPYAEALGVAFSEKILPALVDFAKNDIAPKLEEMRDFFETVAPKVQDMASELADKLQPAVETVINFLGDHKEILGGFAIAVGILTAAWIAYTLATTAAAIATAIVTAPLTAIVLVLAAVAAGAILLYQNWDTLTAKFPVLGQVADAIKEKLNAFTGWITGTFAPALMKIYDAIKDALDKAVGYVKDHADDIKAAIEPPLQALAAVAKAAFEQMKIQIETAWGVIKGVVDVFMGVFTGDWQRAWDGVKEIFKAVWDGLKATAQNGVNLVKELIPIMKEIGKSIMEAFRDGITGIWDTWIWPFFKGLPGQIKSALGDLSRLLWDVGKAIAQGLLDGLVEGAKAVWGEVSSWGGKIKSLKGPMDVDRKLLTPQGYAIALSLEDGLTAGFNEVVLPAVSQWAREITTSFKTGTDMYADVPDYVKRLSPAAGGSKSNADPYVPFNTSWYIGGGQSVMGPSDASKIPVGSYIPGLGYKTATGWEQTMGAAAAVDAAYKNGTYQSGLLTGMQPQVIQLTVDGHVLATAVTNHLARAM